MNENDFPPKSPTTSTSFRGLIVAELADFSAQQIDIVVFCFLYFVFLSVLDVPRYSVQLLATSWICSPPSAADPVYPRFVHVLCVQKGLLFKHHSCRAVPAHCLLRTSHQLTNCCSASALVLVLYPNYPN